MTTPTPKTRFRLCEEDRERYGGPEWITFSVDEVADQPASWCEKFETTTGLTIPALGLELERLSSRGLKAAMWAAFSIAGHEVDWATFDPKVWKAEQEDDSVPLENRATRRSGTRARRSTTSSAATGRSSRTSSAPSRGTTDAGPTSS